MKRLVVLVSVLWIGCSSNQKDTSQSSSASGFSVTPIVPGGQRVTPNPELPTIKRDDEIFSGVSIESADAKMVEMWDGHRDTIIDAVKEIKRTPVSGPDCNATRLALFRGFDATWKWLDSGLRSYEKEYGKPFRLSAQINEANEETKSCMACSVERTQHCAKASVIIAQIDGKIKTKTSK